MFQTNTKHQQRKMFTAVDQLPKTARKSLERSWTQIFYDEYFSKIDENEFSVLYSNKKARPNTPANILMGFETLKSGFGWSDEELYNVILGASMVNIRRITEYLSPDNKSDGLLPIFC